MFISQGWGFFEFLSKIHVVGKMHVLFLSISKLEIHADYLIAFCGLLAFQSHMN